MSEPAGVTALREEIATRLDQNRARLDELCRQQSEIQTAIERDLALAQTVEHIVAAYNHLHDAPVRRGRKPRRSVDQLVMDTIDETPATETELLQRVNRDLPRGERIPRRAVKKALSRHDNEPWLERRLNDASPAEWTFRRRTVRQPDHAPAPQL